jgi:photosystem II stability/assembly factor-like uncharacterized protein
MTRLMVGMHNSVLTLESSNTGWNSRESLEGTQPQSIAFDPLNSGRVYCATFGNGLWRSDDNGLTWGNIGKDVISSPYVMSVAVSSLISGNKFDKVYAGTEPSALYTSNDGGDSWERMKALDDLPSSKSWSFPPRPWTHHVRWIEPDANNPNYVFAAIEAGALVQSHDGGKTWIDRNQQGPYDTHTLATHSKAPRRLYSSAGDGYYESYDYGETWTRPMKGLRHNYLFGIAVDSGNPEAVIVSASNGPSRSYVAENAVTFVYRRDGDGKEWKTVTEGLPEPRGSTMMSFTSNAKTPGELYGVNNHGLFLSTDAGSSWKRLDTLWPREYLQQTPWTIAINEH